MRHELTEQYNQKLYEQQNGPIEEQTNTNEGQQSTTGFVDRNGNFVKEDQNSYFVQTPDGNVIKIPKSNNETTGQQKSESNINNTGSDKPDTDKDIPCIDEIQNIEGQRKIEKIRRELVNDHNNEIIPGIADEYLSNHKGQLSSFSVEYLQAIKDGKIQPTPEENLALAAISKMGPKEATYEVNGLTAQKAIVNYINGDKTHKEFFDKSFAAIQKELGQISFERETTANSHRRQLSLWDNARIDVRPPTVVQLESAFGLGQNPTKQNRKIQLWGAIGTNGEPSLYIILRVIEDPSFVGLTARCAAIHVSG